MTAATIPMVWAENPLHDDITRCAVCDRPVGDYPKYIEVIDGGSSVAAPGLGPDPNDPGYMGFFPVGPTCAKKYFRGFTVND